MTARRASAEGVPGRYATALYELASESRAVDQVGRDLARFGELLDESPDLVRLVRSPVFAAEDQVRALDAVLESAGIGGLAANFIKLIARNRRLFAVRDMIAAYRARVAEEKGEITAEVTSAEPLSDAHTDLLKEALRDKVGRHVSLSARVDPAIIGGLIVKVGSRMVDNSLRTKLQNLRIAMKGSL